MARATDSISSCLRPLQTLVLFLSLLLVAERGSASSASAASSCPEPFLQLPPSSWLAQPPPPSDAPYLFSVTLSAWGPNPLWPGHYLRQLTTFVTNTGNATASISVTASCTAPNLVPAVSASAQPDALFCSSVPPTQYCLVDIGIAATASGQNNSVAQCTINAVVAMQPCYSTVGKNITLVTTVPLVFDPCLNPFPEPCIEWPRTLWLAINNGSASLPPDPLSFSASAWSIVRGAPNATSTLSFTVSNGGDAAGLFVVSVSPPSTGLGSAAVVLSRTNFTCQLAPGANCLLSLQATTQLTSSPTQSMSGYAIHVTVLPPTDPNQCSSSVGKSLDFASQPILLPVDPCAQAPLEPSLLQPLGAWSSGLQPPANTFWALGSSSGWVVSSSSAAPQQPLFNSSLSVSVLNAGLGAANVTFSLRCSNFSSSLGSQSMAARVSDASNAATCINVAPNTACTAEIPLVAPSSDDAGAASICLVTASIIGWSSSGCWSSYGKSVSVSTQVSAPFDPCTAYRTDPMLDPGPLLIAQSQWSLVPATETSRQDFVLSGNATLLLQAGAPANVTVTIQCEEASAVSAVVQLGGSFVGTASATDLLLPRSASLVQWLLSTNQTSTSGVACTLSAAIVRSDPQCWSPLGKSVTQPFITPPPSPDAIECSVMLDEAFLLPSSGNKWPDGSANRLMVQSSPWFLVNGTAANLNLTAVAFNRGNGSALASWTLQCSGSNTSASIGHLVIVEPQGTNGATCFLAPLSGCFVSFTLAIPDPQPIFSPIECQLQVDLGSHVCWSTTAKQLSEAFTLTSPPTSCLLDGAAHREGYLIVNASTWLANPLALNSLSDPFRLSSTNWFAIGTEPTSNLTVYELILHATVSNAGSASGTITGSLTLQAADTSVVLFVNESRTTAECWAPPNTTCSLAFVLQSVGDFSAAMASSTSPEAIASISVSISGDETSCWSGPGKNHTQSDITIAYPTSDCVADNATEPRFLPGPVRNNPLQLVMPHRWHNLTTTSNSTNATATSPWTLAIGIQGKLANGGNSTASVAYSIACQLPAFVNANDTWLSVADLTPSPWYCVMGPWPAACSLDLQVTFVTSSVERLVGDIVCSVSARIARKSCWSGSGKAITQVFELPDPLVWNTTSSDGGNDDDDDDDGGDGPYDSSDGMSAVASNSSSTAAAPIDSLTSHVRASASGAARLLRRSCIAYQPFDGGCTERTDRYNRASGGRIRCVCMLLCESLVGMPESPVR